MGLGQRKKSQSSHGPSCSQSVSSCKFSRCIFMMAIFHLFIFELQALKKAWNGNCCTTRNLFWQALISTNVSKSSYFCKPDSIKICLHKIVRTCCKIRKPGSEANPKAALISTYIRNKRVLPKSTSEIFE